MNRNQGLKLASIVATGNKRNMRRAIDNILEGETGKHWIRDLNKLKQFLQDGKPRFSVFAKDGNGKLPFVAFSSLPGRGFCPGAGDCLNFCYSFRAWRYPAAFCRQVQNSVLMQSEAGRAVILFELDTMNKYSLSFESIGYQGNNDKAEFSIEFRLYVDGDFGDVSQVNFWMEALKDRPWLNAYGYSKSFSELLEYGKDNAWPDNYTLNLSSGHKHGPESLELMRQLPVTRGEFIAVSLGRKVKSSDHGTKDHNRELRQAHGRKAFTCPGKCGDCTLKGHACGSKRFKGIDIIIAVH